MITNESEAMEVWQEAKAVHDGCVSAIVWTSSRVLATALEARDARIAELEGALVKLAAMDGFSGPDAECEMSSFARAILTKGNTHD